MSIRTKELESSKIHDHLEAEKSSRYMVCTHIYTKRNVLCDAVTSILAVTPRLNQGYVSCLSVHHVHIQRPLLVSAKISMVETVPSF